MLRSALGTPPNTSILLDNVVCSGEETNVLDCDHNGIGVVTCDRSHEAGVQCEGTVNEYNAVASSSIICTGFSKNQCYLTLKIL